MADPLGADALAALVNELNIAKHEPKLRAANVTTLRQLKALDDDGLAALGLPKGPTVRLREKLKAVAANWWRFPTAWTPDVRDALLRFLEPS